VFVTSLYYYTTFYKATVLVIKPFIEVEEESNSGLFVGGNAKILFAPGAGYTCTPLNEVD